MNTTGRARKTASTFRMECAVGTVIDAEPERIWALLTNAAGFPSWNTTVTKIEGTIALGEKLAVRVPISERTFTPRVTTFEPGRRMVWSDGAMPFFKGERTFTLEPRTKGTTEFSMVEVFRGVMLPLAKGSLPDFGPPFEQYANDLKRAAETKD